VTVKHLITLEDVDPLEIERVFSISEDLKAKYQQGLREPILPGRVVALLFEKPSLRTRVSFEAGIINLGGNSLFLGNDVGWGSRESVADFTRVLSEFVDVIVVRAKQHQILADMLRYTSCPLINGLTDYAHPCQVLADLYTLKELVGRLDGLKLAYVGDGNNMARSLATGCAKLGLKFAGAFPEGYELEEDFLGRLRQQQPDAEVTLTNDPVEAVKDAVAVYTDVWASMGQESERQKRLTDFASFQINSELMAHAPSSAYFLHCLPAHRGEEVTDEVIDGPQSVVVQQAANRLHVQKGILAWLLGPVN